MHANTYNLKAILESDLDPTLCKLMLHQIKSPLLEHSFQLTTDDQYTGGSFTMPNSQQIHHNTMNSYRQYNKNSYRARDEEQAQIKRMNRKLDDISITQSKYEQSRRDKYTATSKKIQFQEDFIQQPSRQVQHEPKFILNDLAEPDKNIVSPFQYYQTSNRYREQTEQSTYQPLPNNQNLILKDLPQNRYQLRDNLYRDVAAWCGDLFDSRHARENEIIFDGIDKGYKRKKIFQQGKNQTYKSINQQLTFKQAVQKLNQIEELEMSRFVQLLGKVLQLFRNTNCHRDNLQKNQSIIYKMMINENPMDHETRETIANKNRIINRLKVTKMSEALIKLCNFNKHPTHSLQGVYQSQIEVDIGKAFQYLSEIEDLIEDYASKKEAVSDLHKIYNLLYDKQINTLFQVENKLQIKCSNVSSVSQSLSPPSPIATLKNTKNSKQDQVDLKVKQIKSQVMSLKSSQAQPVTHQFVHCQSSLKQKLNNLLVSLRINPHLYQNLQDLRYIWSELSVQGNYSPISEAKYKSNKQKFINELCRNDILVHEATRGITELNIEKKLTEMGFRRNVE